MYTSAIDVQMLAGDVARSSASQENHHGGDLLYFGRSLVRREAGSVANSISKSSMEVRTTTIADPITPAVNIPSTKQIRAEIILCTSEITRNS
jgi:hypothetical protein